ncbi:MAG: thioredoxin [Fimbriimonadaceae bacterium]
MNKDLLRATVIDLTQESFKREVIDNPRPILIDFWAPWCGPCRTMKPILGEAAQALDGIARVAQINVDNEPRIAEAFGIRGIPTLVLVQEGKVLDSFTGVIPAKRLVEQVSTRLAARAPLTK